MKLDLKREIFTGHSTIGRLKLDGEFFCYTLEDPVRLVKIVKETAIPAGKYAVEVTYSPRFKKPLPLLKNVPNYEGVRIHPGNSGEDTEGCILVGNRTGDDYIYGSKVTFEALMARLEGQQDIEIIIK